MFLDLLFQTLFFFFFFTFPLISLSSVIGFHWKYFKFMSASTWNCITLSLKCLHNFEIHFLAEQSRDFKISRLLLSFITLAPLSAVTRNSKFLWVLQAHVSLSRALGRVTQKILILQKYWILFLNTCFHQWIWSTSSSLYLIKFYAASYLSLFLQSPFSLDTSLRQNRLQTIFLVTWPLLLKLSHNSFWCM